MDVGEMAAAVRAALELLPTDLVAHARDRLGAAKEGLTQAVAGSTHPDVVESLTALAQAQEALGEVDALFRQVRDLMGAYLARVVDGPTRRAPVLSVPARQDPATDVGSSAGALRLDRGPNGVRVEQILRELPAPVPRPNPEGRKTHGRVIGEDDAEVVSSGRDEESRQVVAALRERGVGRAPMLRVTEHVEMKVAVRMIRGEVRHTEVVINNSACEGPYGCDRLLPVLLPAGYSMTVHGPGYKRTFHGGAKWSK